jgi:hypothetical protein
MLAPRWLDSPRGSNADDLPARRLAACAASSRADTTRGAAGGARRSALAPVGFLAEAFPKIAIPAAMPLE